LRTRPRFLSSAAAVRRVPAALLFVTVLAHAPVGLAAGGPLGIDSRGRYDNSGLWARSNQNVLIDSMMAVVGVGALWEGGEDRLGKTFWQSVDSGVVSGVAGIALKYAFSRERPSQTSDPNRWFTGHGQSFPSGEVTTLSSLVTPFVLEYGSDHPMVYALELLPVYDGIARVKTWGHWQTDVLAGFALGTATGYFLHRSGMPLILSVLPGGFEIGFRRRF